MTGQYALWPDSAQSACAMPSVLAEELTGCAVGSSEVRVTQGLPRHLWHRWSLCCCLGAGPKLGSWLQTPCQSWLTAAVGDAHCAQPHLDPGLSATSCLVSPEQESLRAAQT